MEKLRDQLLPQKKLRSCNTNVQVVLPRSMLFVNWEHKVWTPKKLKLGVSTMDSLISGVSKTYFTELAKRALRDTQIREIHELKALRRDQELRSDVFSKWKQIEDQYTIWRTHWKSWGIAERDQLDEWLKGFQRCWISTQADHCLTFPGHQLYFLFFQECCSAALEVLQPDIWNTQGISGNIFSNSPAYSSSPCSRTLKSWDGIVAERIPMLESMGEPVAGVSHRERDTPWDSHEVRQPKIHSTWWTEESLGIMWQANRDFKSRNITLTVPYSTNVIVLENKIQDWSLFLLKFPHGSFAMIKQVELANSADD